MATYKKMPGISQGVGGYSRLWLGEDHLLLVTSGGISEDYRRFYFSDMQAFIIRKTASGWIANVVLGLITFFFLLGAVFNSDVERIICLTIAVCFGLPLLINTLLGPTCACFVHTATARHALPPLQRVRRARNLLDRIHPLITAVQGEPTEEQLNSIRAPGAEFTASAPPVIS